MFTPQEIQEQTFSKAVFGGYDMQQVDEFLEPLTEDYITLYKENSVLRRSSPPPSPTPRPEAHRCSRKRRPSAPPCCRTQR